MRLVYDNEVFGVIVVCCLCSVWSGVRRSAPRFGDGGRHSLAFLSCLVWLTPFL